MKTIVLFPGQGSQESGMGRDTAEARPQAMDLWKKAERLSGLPLREVYWESGDDTLMADTRHLQPALTVVNLSLWLMLASEIGRCDLGGASGHSLGEYSALAAAGVLQPEEVLELVCLRGRLMAEADPDGRGGMAAVLKLPRLDVEAIVREVAAETGEILLIANYNTPAQFVISGTKTAIDACLPLIKERKGRAMPLAVSGAFHSPLMRQAASELNTVLTRLTWRKPHFPIYSNVSGTAVTDGESLRELGSRQMISSVLWIDSIANQYRDGTRRWIEVGPKGVLSRMIKPIIDEIGTDPVDVQALGTAEAAAAWKA